MNSGKVCFDLIFKSGGSVRFKFFSACLLDISVVLFAVGAPALLKIIIDDLSSATPSKNIVLFGIGYGAMWLASELLLRLRAYVTTDVIEAAKAQALSRLCINSILKPGNGSKPIATGAFAAKMAQISYAITIFIDGVAWQIAPLIVRLILSISALLYFAPYIYSVLLIASVSGFALVSVLTYEKIGDRQRLANIAMQDASSTIVDSLINREITLAHATELHEFKCISQSLSDSKRSAIASMAYSQFVSGAQIFLLGLGLIVITGKSILDVQGGVLTVGGMMQINAYLLQFVLPVSYFGMMISGIKRASVTLVADIDLLRSASIVDDLEAEPKGGRGCDIEIKNLSFCSQDGKQCLENINLAIRAGECVAIVGSSGAGKTSMAKAILGLLYNPGGSISIDSNLCSQGNMRAMRKSIGYVPQQPYLFNRDLLSNVFLTECSMTDKERILNSCGIDLKMLPPGIASTCSDLSGGEKQRVSLARAIARRPSLLILDEPTSSLDVHHKSVIMKTLFESCNGITRLIVTHDLNLASRADRIVVMQEGRILQCGAHSSLLKEDGWYRKHWSNNETDKAVFQLEVESHK